MHAFRKDAEDNLADVTVIEESDEANDSGLSDVTFVETPSKNHNFER